MKLKKPELKYHKRSCYTCRYYRQHRKAPNSDCLLLGRMLSITRNPSDDRARICDGWKQRPKTWDIVCEYNPFWDDVYIPRKTQINLRKKYRIK